MPKQRDNNDDMSQNRKHTGSNSGKIAGLGNLSDRLVSIRDQEPPDKPPSWPPSFEEFAATCDPRKSLF